MIDRMAIHMPRLVLSAFASHRRVSLPAIAVCALIFCLPGCHRSNRSTEETPDRTLSAYHADGQYGKLAIKYPLNETVFPPESVAPHSSGMMAAPGADSWVVTIAFGDGKGPLQGRGPFPQWTPDAEIWDSRQAAEPREPRPA